MEFFRRYNTRRVERHFLLVFAVFLLTGCAGGEQPAVPVSEEVEDTSNKTEERQETANYDAVSGTNTDTYVDTASYVLLNEDLIQWDQVKETETEDYYIVAVQEENEDGEMEEYPQMVCKEGREIFCGVNKINEQLVWISEGRDYNILYADRYYISLWCGNKGGVGRTYFFDLQCQDLYKDDNDYRDAPWPSGEIPLSLDAMLEEIERGNCSTDEAGFEIYREDPEAFIRSVRRQFAEIREGGYEEAYWVREFEEYSKKAYKMYLREGRVGFYIHPIEVWEETESKQFYKSRSNPIDTSRDFRIEVAYDWQKDAPAYHMSYEVYTELCESGTYGSFYYPQIRGVDENIVSALNTAMKQDLDENLAYLDLDAANERIQEKHGFGQYWTALPPVNQPGVTYRTEKYLCIYQYFGGNYTDVEMVCFTEEWKRYHVYDLETGESLRLGDMIQLDEDFVMWLKQEKKVDARLFEITGWEEKEMNSVNDPGEWLKEELDDYPADILLSVLENGEFWLKEGNLFVRIPRYNEEASGCSEYGGMVYQGGGTGHPPWLVFYDVRIALDDLQEFLLVEPWGE